MALMPPVGVDLTSPEIITNPPVQGVVHANVGQKVLKRHIILIFSNFTVSQN